MNRNKPVLPAGVGKTSLLIAASRAEAQKILKEDPPFSDPLAAVLAAAAFDEETDTYPIMTTYSPSVGGYRIFILINAVRTMWFDKQVTAAVARGINLF